MLCLMAKCHFTRRFVRILSTRSSKVHDSLISLVYKCGLSRKGLFSFLISKIILSRDKPFELKRFIVITIGGAYSSIQIDPRIRNAD